MLYIGSDHGGFHLKEEIMKFLDEKGVSYEDLGNTEFDEKDDYPDYAIPVARKVVETNGVGIVLCRSAAGVVIAANKVKGARAFAAFDEKSAKHSREHNDANIIALSGDWMEPGKAVEILETWLSTEFSGEERHIRRLNKIKEYENES